MEFAEPAVDGGRREGEDGELGMIEAELEDGTGGERGADDREALGVVGEDGVREVIDHVPAVVGAEEDEIAWGGMVASPEGGLEDLAIGFEEVKEDGGDAEGEKGADGDGGCAGVGGD